MEQDPLDNHQRQEITELILNRRTIEAIKRYREITGVGLAEAKKAVERLQEELSLQHPELKRGRSGCGALIVVMIGALLLLVCIA